MIKKTLFIFSLSLLLTVNVFAQKDSAYKRGITIKINFLKLASMPLGGDIGGFIQVPVSSHYDIFAGGGYDEFQISSVDGNTEKLKTYTVNAGFCYFLNKKYYLGFEFSFRPWRHMDSIIFDGSDANNSLISPINSSFSQSLDLPYNYLAFAKSNVYCFDFIGGRNSFGSGHFLFGWYAGFGFRFKYITVEETGSYSPDKQFYPFSSPKYVYETPIYPDIKLGVNIGYKF